MTTFPCAVPEKVGMGFGTGVGVGLAVGDGLGVTVGVGEGVAVAEGVISGVAEGMPVLHSGVRGAVVAGAGVAGTGVHAVISRTVTSMSPMNSFLFITEAFLSSNLSWKQWDNLLLLYKKYTLMTIINRFTRV